MLKKENWSMTTSMRPATAATSIITTTSTIMNMAMNITMSIIMRRYTTQAGNLTIYPPA